MRGLEVTSMTDSTCRGTCPKCSGRPARSHVCLLSALQLCVFIFGAPQMCPPSQVTPQLKSRLPATFSDFSGLQGVLPLVLRLGPPCWNECEWEGARSRGSPWPGCWQVYRLLSPPVSSLSFPAKRPRPFLCPCRLPHPIPMFTGVHSSSPRTYCSFPWLLCRE